MHLEWHTIQWQTYFQNDQTPNISIDTLTEYLNEQFHNRWNDMVVCKHRHQTSLPYTSIQNMVYGCKANRREKLHHRCCKIHESCISNIHRSIKVKNQTHVHMTFQTRNDLRNKILAKWHKSLDTLHVISP